MENSTQAATSKSSKDEKQKDLKLEEQILKSLSGYSTIEEKLSALIKKFVDTEKDNKKLNATIKLHEKRFETISREKENLQREYNKGLLVRDKLEEVCREQQKLIKSIKNESLTKIREEEERRKENATRFQQSINEINVTLNKNNEENNKLREDNIEMTKKLKFLAEQYQAREKQLEKITEQVQLETQLHEAKVAKVKMEATIEKEILLREKQCALDELLACKKAIQESIKREELLKEQLNIYTSKYDDFQSSLQKSNDIFTSYKAEIEKMSKTTKRLEKENLEWRQKFAKSNAALIELATEKQSKDEYVAKAARQVQQLQKLLRTLQAERTTLHEILKENNIERPPMPVLPPEPEPISLPTIQKYDKLDVMVKNCAELKENLAKLQGQMNEITAKQNNPPSTSSSVKEDKNNAAAKKNKTKKSKSKNKKDIQQQESLTDESSVQVEKENSQNTDEQQKSPENLSVNDPCVNPENIDREENPPIAIPENTISPPLQDSPKEVETPSNEESKTSGEEQLTSSESIFAKESIDISKKLLKEEVNANSDATTVIASNSLPLETSSEQQHQQDLIPNGSINEKAKNSLEPEK